MARIKATAYVEGKETEVEIDDEKYIPKAQHDIRVKETVRQRLARQAGNIRGELMKDDDFVNEVLTSKGVDPKTLKPAESTGKALTESDVARLQEEWRNKELTPIKTQLDTANKRFETSNQKALLANLEKAFISAGVPETLAPRFAELEASRFGLDDKSGRHALKNGESFAFSTAATDEMPYKGVDEYVKEWAGDPRNKDFVKKQTQDGPGIGDKPSNGTTPAGGKRSEMTVEQRSAFIEKNGFEKFTQLPA